jgi:large subunit ribosomal protein L4
MSRNIIFIENDKVGQITAPETLNVELKPTFLSQALFIYRSNQSRSISNTKTRSEVSGTTRKPWKQKGTGRARHGSMRSPIWIGGATVFGPTNLKNNSKRSTSKQRSLALRMLLSLAIDSNKVIVVSNIPVFKKTKEAAQWLSKLPMKPGYCNIITDSNEVKSAFRNIAFVNFQSATNPNLGQLADSDYIIISKQDFENISNRDNKKMAISPVDTKTKLESKKSTSKVGK